MIHRPSNIELLDSTLSALERLILETPDDEVLSWIAEKNHGVADIRALIEQHLGDSKIFPSKRSVVARRSNSNKKQPTSVTRNRNARLAFLRRLLASRPDLSPQLRAAFTAGKVPSNKELDDVMVELIRLGVLPIDESSNE